MRRRADSHPAQKPIRWWPAVAILVVVVGFLAWAWLRDVPSMQHRVVPSLPILFFGALALLVWLVLFSRLAGRLRLVVFMCVAVLVGLGFLLLEIKGVDGNLVPIVGLRGSGERQFEDANASPAGATTPGRHDYPQFYGPERRASLPGPELERDWEQRPPRELWRREVGDAWSSFAIVGAAAITQELRGEDESIVRYDLRTGRQVWVHSERSPFNTTVGGSGPRATPTIDGDRVYALGATGILSCLDLDSGSKLWSRDVLADHRGELPDWGMSSSPLIAGELVMVQLGNRCSGLAAYDRATGQPAWRAGDQRGSYTSPLLATVAGRQQVLVVYGASVVGHDPLTGEILWQHEWPDPGERVTMPLVIDDDRVLVSAGYGVGSRMLRIGRTATGFEVQLLWESRRLKSKFAPTVFHDGVIYGLDDGVLVALDPDTGERIWKRGRYGHGQFVRVGDLLLIQTERGDVVLVEATPREHRETARLPALAGKTWNPPALSGSLLLVRNNHEAAAYELPVRGARQAAGPTRPAVGGH